MTLNFSCGLDRTNNEDSIIDDDIIDTMLEMTNKLLNDKIHEFKPTLAYTKDQPRASVMMALHKQIMAFDMDNYFNVLWTIKSHKQISDKHIVKCGDIIKIHLDIDGSLSISEIVYNSTFKPDIKVAITRRLEKYMLHTDIVYSEHMRRIVTRDTNSHLTIYNLDHQYMDYLSEASNRNSRLSASPTITITDTHGNASRRICEFMRETSSTVYTRLASYCVHSGIEYALCESGVCVKIRLARQADIVWPCVVGQNSVCGGGKWSIVRCDYGVVMVAGYSKVEKRMYIAILNTNLRLVSMRGYDGTDELVEACINLSATTD